jgi:hypothetical protein
MMNSASWQAIWFTKGILPEASSITRVSSSEIYLSKTMASLMPLYIGKGRERERERRGMGTKRIT